MIDQNFVYLGLLIYFFGASTYFVKTIKGEIKPNKVSCFMWGLAAFIAFAAQVSKGVGVQALTQFIVGFMSFPIFFATFFNKKAYWKLGIFDFGCGILSAIGLLLWYLTKEGNIAIVFAIFADLWAYIPTIVKSYFHPETESSLAYFTAGTAAAITLLTITKWNFETFGFPVYLLLISIIVFVLIKFKLGKIFVKYE